MDDRNDVELDSQSSRELALSFEMDAMGGCTEMYSKYSDCVRRKLESTPDDSSLLCILGRLLVWACAATAEEGRFDRQSADKEFESVLARLGDVAPDGWEIEYLEAARAIAGIYASQRWKDRRTAARTAEEHLSIAYERAPDCAVVLLCLAQFELKRPEVFRDESAAAKYLEKARSTTEFRTLADVVAKREGLSLKVKDCGSG